MIIWLFYGILSLSFKTDLIFCSNLPDLFYFPSYVEFI
jgi:uncharacterized protein with PQ loop repeat